MNAKNTERIENIIKSTIKKYNLIEKGDKIIVGVSGGPDSMCLLDSLNRISQISPNAPNKPGINGTNGEAGAKPQTNPEQMGRMANWFEIVVVHVNHMLREEAKDDEQYVKDYCKKNDIEFYAKSIDVKNLANTNKIGTEEAGRIARYQFFDDVLKKTGANKIAVAHNKNDKIETILLHTLRGSGVDGLMGMEVKRGNIIRPLLECERVEIENYCEEKDLKPRIDKTNFENIYNRNKIRNVVIPYIKKEFNSNLIATLDRLSDIVKKENEYMEKQAKKAYYEILQQEQEKEIIIDLKDFNSQETVIKARTIRYIIKRLFGTTACIEKIHIDDIIKLCDKNVGNKYLTPNKNIKVLVKNHKVYFSRLS